MRYRELVGAFVGDSRPRGLWDEVVVELSVRAGKGPCWPDRGLAKENAAAGAGQATCPVWLEQTRTQNLKRQTQKARQNTVRTPTTTGLQHHKRFKDEISSIERRQIGRLTETLSYQEGAHDSVSPAIVKLDLVSVRGLLFSKMLLERG